MSSGNEVHKGAAVVILNHKQEVLLQKREDFRLWDLPGGMVEPGESSESAAIREALEETGLTVALDQLVSIYHYPQRDAATTIYRAHVITGTLVKRSSETVDAGWFSRDHLPGRLNMFVKDAIDDTFLFASKPIDVAKKIPGGMVVLIWIAVKLRTFRNQYLRKD